MRPVLWPWHCSGRAGTAGWEAARPWVTWERATQHLGWVSATGEGPGLRLCGGARPVQRAAAVACRPESDQVPGLLWGEVEGPSGGANGPAGLRCKRCCSCSWNHEPDPTPGAPPCPAQVSPAKAWSSLQDRVLPALSSIFALLLADRSWLLEQHALEAFTQFAEVRRGRWSVSVPGIPMPQTRWRAALCRSQRLPAAGSCKNEALRHAAAFLRACGH